MHAVYKQLLTGAIIPNIEKHKAPINSIIGAIFGTAIAVSITLRTNNVLKMISMS